MKVRIVAVGGEEFVPVRKDGDSGYDLKADIPEEGIVLVSGERKLIPCGIKLEMEDGYEAQIRARSGLALKHGITVLNSPGTIDCVVKGTKIKTIDGDVLVEDLFKTDRIVSVLSYNEEECIVEEDIISDMFIEKDRETIFIELEDGKNVVVASTKEVFTKRGWVFAMDLKDNDEILTF